MIILDSSLLIAFKVMNDVHHGRARAMMDEIINLRRFGKPVITSYIFDETVTGIFVRSKSLALAVEYGDELLSSLEIIEVTDDIFRSAWKIFSAQGKKELSFTDSTTIATMGERGIGNIATFDGDFRGIKEVSPVGIETT